MKELNAIFARGINGEFSLSDGSLPWKNAKELSEDSKNDMEHFKCTTAGQIVIMGFNTYRTFKKPLPERINVVIDRNCNEPSAANKNIAENKFNFFSSLEDALDYFSCIKFSETKIFLIGGAKLFNYAFSKNLINGKIFETVFNCNFSEAATFIDPVSEKWKILSAKKLGENSCLFVRKKEGSADSFPTESNTPLKFQDNPASL